MELEKNKKTRKLLRTLLELEDRVVAKPFPRMRRVKQISSYHCGPAVLSELFSYVGRNISQVAVVKSLRAQKKIRRFGLNIDDLAKATNLLGRKEVLFWRKRNSSMSDISGIIDKYNYPVGVEWQGIFYENEDEDNGHYAIITKVDKRSGYLRVCDSYASFAGVDRRIKIKDFEKRWWDVNKIRGRNIVDNKMMFVVTTKNETWPGKLGMVRIRTN